jgi:nucleotidyltransferase substrate binding protein (TIGR01987 family)
MMDEKPRWVYRLDNFNRAFAQLSEGVGAMNSRELSRLEKEGIIQRFEYTWELAWKVMKDYLENKGVALETVTPAAVIRAAFAANVVENGDLWMEALKDRNDMSHTYDVETFEKIIAAIRDSHFVILNKLHLFMTEKAVKEGFDV